MYVLLEDILSTDMEQLMADCIRIEDPYESVSYYVYCCSGQFVLALINGIMLFSIPEADEG